MKLAQIENGIVMNVVKVNPENVPDWAAGWPQVGEAGIGWTYDGQAFAEPVAQPLRDDERSLSPVRFEWLLAFSGLGDVWAALEGALKDTDRAAYANLRAQRSQLRFVLSVTLGQVAAMRDLAAQIAPGVDLSEAAIRAAWEQAEVVNL